MGLKDIQGWTYSTCMDLSAWVRRFYMEVAGVQSHCSEKRHSTAIHIKSTDRTNQCTLLSLLNFPYENATLAPSHFIMTVIYYHEWQIILSIICHSVILSALKCTLFINFINYSSITGFDGDYHYCYFVNDTEKLWPLNRLSGTMQEILTISQYGLEFLIGTLTLLPEASCLKLWPQTGPTKFFAIITQCID